jgi:hypothetical protein
MCAEKKERKKHKIMENVGYLAMCVQESSFLKMME